MLPYTYGITCKALSFVNWNRQSSWFIQARLNDRLRIRIKRIWKIEEFPTAKRTETRIKMIKLIIDQFEWKDLFVKDGRKDGIGTDIAAVVDSPQTIRQKTLRDLLHPRNRDQDLVE